MKRYGIFLLSLISVSIGWAEEEICFSFEDGNLQGWQIVEGKFGQLITDRNLELGRKGRKMAKVGKWFLSTLDEKTSKGITGNDGFIGKIESPRFRLAAPEISVRVGGGKGTGIYFAVCDAEGKILATARGANSQVLEEKKFSLPDQVGKLTYFTVVDSALGGW